MWSSPSTRLAAAMLGYVSLMIVLMTLNPFFFASPEHIRISLRVRPTDAIANVILFLPVGFLYRLARGRIRGAILLGALLSAGVEVAQVFVPVRTTSLVDLITNTVGAGLGAWLHDRLAAQIALSSRATSRLALEIPLMGFVYLLVPLLWVNALTLDAAPGRWVLTVLIGSCGALVLGEIVRQWSGPAGLRSSWRVALLTAAWLLVGLAPALRPIPTLPLAIAIAALAASVSAIPHRSAERRFERATLGRVLPIFALYLLLSALWPPARPLGPWHAVFGLSDHLVQENLPVLMPLIEYLAAFVILGYLSAEWRGRAELRLALDLPRVLLTALAGALLLEVLAGFQVGLGASLVRLILAILSGLFGGIVYHLQRDQIRFLLGRDGGR